MNTEHGFVDLRLNHRADQANESFWPSFTDIMTVIVMIFLISMVVLLIRNMELVNEIRATMEAERSAMELARTTGREKENLATELNTTSDRLNAAQDRAVQLQLQIMRLQEQNTLRAKVISQRNQDLQALTEERNSLAQKSAQLLLTRQQLETDVNKARSELGVSKQNLTFLQNRFGTLETHYQESEEQLAKAKTNLERNIQLLVASQSDQQLIEEKYLLQADEFDDLKVRYDKLVRPARSSKGRYLVEVRYLKKGKGYNIGLRAGGNAAFVSLSPSALEKKMVALKQSHPDGLYVKVILPENSGLSYNEAWKFTNNLHKKFDYYFQESKTTE